jgi:hypothetical protein
MCDKQFDSFQGCNGFCVQSGFTLNILEDFFEEHQCHNPVSELYPAMCDKHAISFNMVEKWNDMPDYFKSIVSYISNPNECPLIFFELFIVGKFIPWRIAVKILLEPLCFWIINEEHFAITILFGYRFLGTKSLESGDSDFLDSETKFTYAYVLDSICQIIPWIMNANEDLENISADELIAIKWFKVSQMMLNGFMLCLGANGMPRQIPNFIPEWEDVWRTRFKYWLKIHFANNALDTSQVDQCWNYFEKLLSYIRICVSFAIHNPGSEKSIANLYNRLVEYDSTI